MTRKHFEQFAELIRELEKDDDISPYARLRMAGMVAYVAQKDNPRFDWIKFYRACDIPTREEEVR